MTITTIIQGMANGKKKKEKVELGGCYCLYDTVNHV